MGGSAEQRLAPAMREGPTQRWSDVLSWARNWQERPFEAQRRTEHKQSSDGGLRARALITLGHMALAAITLMDIGPMAAATRDYRLLLLSSIDAGQLL